MADLSKEALPYTINPRLLNGGSYQAPQDFGKVYFRSQILECPNIGKYWNISGVPVLLENVIFTFFRMC